MTFPDLIFVSLENWDEVWRRNQFLCSGLARRFPESKILFVGLPCDLSNSLRRRDFSGLAGHRTWKVPGYDNITVTRPLKFAPNTLPSGRRWNERIFRNHVRREAQRLKLRNPLLWINPHDAVHLAGRLGESAVVYDITDDWTLGTISPMQKSLIVEQDRRLCRRADLVVVCSEALQKSREAQCKRLLLLPNGVDVEHYRDVASDGGEMAAWLPSLPAPVFGYTGTLHDDRTDPKLIVALARAFPEGSVLLIGPDHLSRESRELLEAQPNIHLTGPVAYAKIANAMQAFDVCIVPHKESAFTESLNPIKLWEYLAFGKPVVSTDVAGFRDFPHLVRVATKPQEFIDACRQALHENGAGLQARQAEAAQHSWSRRIDDLLEALKPILQKSKESKRPANTS